MNRSPQAQVRQGATAGQGVAPEPTPEKADALKRLWTAAEDAVLTESRAAGMTHADTAETLASLGYATRSVSAVATRAWHLGLAGRIEVNPRAMGFAAFPRYPQRVRTALHLLAESDPSPAEYERRKREILGESR